MTAKRRLLQDISHELRSPLARLSIGVELLRTTADRERAIGRLRIDVERLTTLVGSLLEVTRSEGDPSSRRSETMDVAAIVREPAHTAIDVRLTESQADTVVSVRDVGPGVPEALLPRLTDPFFRVDAARDANTGGVGLGLAIARRALHLHHGTLVAENANPGLRVTLTIPRETRSSSCPPGVTGLTVCR